MHVVERLLLHRCSLMVEDASAVHRTGRVGAISTAILNKPNIPGLRSSVALLPAVTAPA